MEDKVTKDSEGHKRHHGKHVPKHAVANDVRKVDFAQWLDEQFERMMKCYQKMKEERDRDSG